MARTSQFNAGPRLNAPPMGDPSREAVASLRGYAYQLYTSALAWIAILQELAQQGAKRIYLLPARSSVFERLQQLGNKIFGHRGPTSPRASLMRGNTASAISDSSLKVHGGHLACLQDFRCKPINTGIGSRTNMASQADGVAVNFKRHFA